MNEAQLKSVFRDVYNMNKILEEFSKQAIVLREISVNSAIAAGHVGAESAALGEIAKQIGTLSVFLSESVTDAHQATGQISNCILTCIVQAAQREKMLAALNLIEKSAIENHQTVREVTDVIGKNVSEQLCQAKRSIQQLNPMVARLKQVIHRTWSIIMSLKVSSGIADEEEGSFFLSIAGSLEQMVEICAQRTEALLGLIQIVDTSLKSACECLRGGFYAA